MRIQLDHVSKYFGEKKVLQEISLSVRHGEMAAISGASGIGKTTLLRILLGLELPDSGTVLRERKDATVLPPGKTAFAGCVFQEDRLMEEISAVKNLSAALAGTARLKEPAIRRVLEELLPEDSLDQPVSELSGGMRRRVCLARACLCPAEWLVLDEPFTGLDEENRRKAAAFLEKYRGGRTVIMATHSLDLFQWDQVISLA